MNIKFIRALILMVLCYILWLLISNDYHYLSLIIGIIFSLAATLYSHDIFFENEVFPRRNLIIRFEYFLLFMLIFIIQSYLASFELIYRIITGKYQPSIIRIKTRLQSQLGKAFLANTITMIPGTLSLWLDGNHIYIHWFNTKTTHSIKASSLIKQNIENILEKIFG